METVTPKVLTVGQLNKYIKSVLDSDYHLKNIFLSGEISNFVAHRSGHYYMTLKDANGAVKAVMFRSAASRLKFRPENGMKVIAFGSVSVYEASGQYQFYVENLQPDGLGSLNLAFEQLKEKLQAQGLFNPEYKKPLPKYPMRIGVLTSPTGAAFQDIKNVITRRWPLAEIILAPTLVQGDGAPPQIVHNLYALDDAGVDVIIVARGGGSIEDLWAFNDERVARAVFDCETPVISGVGHETDFTIVDFVSDFRAPTPSAAAEVCVPDRFEEHEQLLQLQTRMKGLMKTRVDMNRAKVQSLASSNVLKSMQSMINEKRLYLDRCTDRMAACAEKQVQREVNRLGVAEERLHRLGTEKVKSDRQRLSICAGKLDAYCPLKVLSRGYSITTNEQGNVVQKTADVAVNDKLQILVQDGTVNCLVESITTEEAKTNG